MNREFQKVAEKLLEELITELEPRKDCKYFAWNCAKLQGKAELIRDILAALKESRLT